MDKDINESCEGCTMFKDDGWCSIVTEGKEKDCPCRACLVKVMCNHSCKDYSIFIKERKWGK
jgi:hypothetical protein